MAHKSSRQYSSLCFQNKMLKKPDVLEKIRYHIRVQHPQIYSNQLVLSLSFFFVLHSVIGLQENCAKKVILVPLK